MQEALRPLLEPFRDERVLAGLGVASLVMFVLSVLGVPFVLARLPVDYFSRGEATASVRETPLGPGRLLLRIAKNALGVVFVVLGVLMLVLPGQGLLTLFVGLLLVDFPGKKRLERRIVGAPRVLRVVNTLRRRWNRPPLEI